MVFFRQLFDRSSCTYTYVLADSETREAVLIDPVREQFQRDVIPMYYEYLKPTRRHADLIVSGDTEVSSLASQVMKTLNLKKIAI